MSPPKALPPREHHALTVALESESLEALYAAWLDFRLQRAQALAARAEQAQQLDLRAAYLLKTVEAARAMPAEVAPPSEPPKGKGKAKKKPPAKGKGKKALEPQDPLARFHAEAQAEVDRAREALRERGQREDKDAHATDARVRKALLIRADQHLRIHKPRVVVAVHPVGASQVILQVVAPGDEDSALLLRLLHRKLPTRWGFYGDDAVDDLARGPARFYRDEGLTELWPKDVEAEDAVLFGEGDFLPVRQQLPFALPDRAFPRFRLVHHGPMSQVEARREGQPYQHVLAREDGELLTGYLLRLKLAGRIELELQVG